MTTALGIVAALLAVSLLIVVHEAGHLLVARGFGMRVERFSIGFGPVLVRLRRGETEFVVSALPLGGYVRIAGMAPGESDDPQDPGLYSNQAAWRRFAVILAGPAMNYVAAVLVAFGLLVTLGLHAPDPAPRVGPLVPGMPAEKAGLRPGDTIVSVAGKPVDSFLGVVAELQRHPGREIALEIDRAGGERAVVRLTPKDDRGVGRVGFRQAEVVVRGGPVRSLAVAFQATNAAALVQLRSFVSLLQRRQGADGGGPLRIGEELVQRARDGIEPFLTFVWMISIVLALFNLFPIPALDGGRLVFLAYEIVTRRRVNERVENYVHVAGFVLLVALVLAVTVFKDLPRLLGG